jgi:hypothetical protein
VIFVADENTVAQQLRMVRFWWSGRGRDRRCMLTLDGKADGPVEHRLIVGLAEKGVGAGTFCPLEGGLVGIGREVDSRDVNVLFFEDAGRFYTVQVALQVDVEQQEIRRVFTAVTYGPPKLKELPFVFPSGSSVFLSSVSRLTRYFIPSGK